MASDGKRTLGAIVVVAVASLLVGRYVIRKDKKLEEPRAVASASTIEAHASYESALVDASIRGMSSGVGTALAVGDDGAIFERKVDGAKWTKMTSPVKVTLRAVAQQLDEAIAVGDEGTILELEGDAWKSVPSGTKRALRAVTYTSYGAVAVGDGGTLVRRMAAHEPWRAEPSGTESDLYGACAGLRDVWVVGKGGAIVTRAGDAWKLHPSVGGASLYAVACDDHAAIAVGERGTMLQRLDDVGWHETPSGVTADLLAAAAPLGTRSFIVVGAAGTVVHVTGEASVEPQAVTFDLRAVTEGPLGTWVGGERGIFRRAPI